MNLRFGIFRPFRRGHMHKVDVHTYVLQVTLTPRGHTQHYAHTRTCKQERVITLPWTLRGIPLVCK